MAFVRGHRVSRSLPPPESYSLWGASAGLSPVFCAEGLSGTALCIKAVSLAQLWLRSGEHSTYSRKREKEEPLTARVQIKGQLGFTSSW